MTPAWALVSQWEETEPLVRRTPIPEPLLRAMVTLALLRGRGRWAGAALLCFEGIGGIGAVLQVERRDLLLPSDLLDADIPKLHFYEYGSQKVDTAKNQHLRVVDVRTTGFLESCFAGLSPSSK